MSRARTLADLFNTDGNLNLSPVDSINAGQVGGRRNLIINGAMQVAQRATSASAVHPNYVSLDRYMTNASGGGAFTLSQETDTPSGQGFKNSMKVFVDTADSSIAAGDFYLIQHRIEGQNVAHLMLGTANATKVTLSFWVKSSLTGNFGGSFVNGAANRSYPFQYNISSANAWQKITETVQLDTSGTWATDNTIGIKILFDFGSGTTYQGTADTWASANYHTASSSVQLIGTGSATWYITGLQLELGENASDFEHRSFGEELALCQRYYFATEKLTGQVASATNAMLQGLFPTQMRASPTVSGGPYTIWQMTVAGSKTQSSAQNNADANQNNNKSFHIQCGNFSGLSQFYPVGIASGGPIKFEAEL